jgi:hypothetical protein
MPTPSGFSKPDASAAELNRRSVEAAGGRAANSVLEIAMPVVNWVVVVQVLIVLLQSRRSELYWMAAEICRGLPYGQTYGQSEIDKGSGPEGGELSAKRETTRQAPGHHPSLQ